MNSYSLFEAQLFVCYWAFVETEHLVRSHQFNKRPEVPIRNWVLSGQGLGRNMIGQLVTRSSREWCMDRPL